MHENISFQETRKSERTLVSFDQAPNVDNVLPPTTGNCLRRKTLVSSTQRALKFEKVKRLSETRSAPVGRANRSKRHDRRVTGRRNSNKLALFGPEHLVFLTL